MKKILAVSLALGAAAALAACSDTDGGGANPTPTPTGTATPTPTPSNVVEVANNITANTTWTADKEYLLKSHVFVEAGTLTIEPGTVIKGEQQTSLVITKNAKIDAVGTAAAPIVFTSAASTGTRSAGDWGGVVLLGKAAINVTGGTEPIEGFATSYGDLIVYGGGASPDDTHDCGDLVYVRIEYAGFELAVDKELNGLGVGACGSQTNIDYVQIHKGADDGVEMFGGTANLKHIVITQPDDDGLDWDQGWTGKAQFVVIQQNTTVGNMGIEADNNGNANDALPRSNPTIYNMTMIGSNAEPGLAGKKQVGIHVRRGTAAKMFNVLMTGFADGHVDVDGAASVAQANAGELFLKNSLFFDNANTSDAWPPETGAGNDASFDEDAFFTADATKNNVFSDPMMSSDSTNLLAPNFVPASGSPALTGGATPPNDGFFDASATFIGAFGATDWTAGWTVYPAD